MRMLGGAIQSVTLSAAEAMLFGVEDSSRATYDYPSHKCVPIGTSTLAHGRIWNEAPVNENLTKG